MDHCITFRHNKPASPHLSGKVERSQKTDREELWVLADLHKPESELRLTEWQYEYSRDRPHGSLNGRTALEMLHTKSEDTPFWDEVKVSYEAGKERSRLLTIRQTWPSGDTSKRDTGLERSETMSPNRQISPPFGQS